MSIDPSILAAADYADALVSARRAKRVLCLLLLVMLLAQIALFFVCRTTTLLDPVMQSDGVAAATASSSSSSASSPPISRDALIYATAITLHAGMIFSLLLPLVLLLICHIMLVGRLIGVAPVVSSFVLALLLALILFPWQTLLNVGDMTRSDFVFPGIFYTWPELSAHARFATDNLNIAVLKWTRFVAAPAVAVLLLLVVQLRSGRGLRLALGEDVLPNSDQPHTSI